VHIRLGHTCSFFLSHLVTVSLEFCPNLLSQFLSHRFRIDFQVLENFQIRLHVVGEWTDDLRKSTPYVHFYGIGTKFEAAGFNFVNVTCKFMSRVPLEDYFLYQMECLPSIHR
jgi:hypothetical protein